MSPITRRLRIPVVQHNRGGYEQAYFQLPNSQVGLEKRSFDRRYLFLDVHRQDVALESELAMRLLKASLLPTP